MRILPWSFIVFIFTEPGDYFIEFLSIFPQIHVVNFGQKFNGNDVVNLGMHNIRRYIMQSALLLVMLLITGLRLCLLVSLLKS